MGDAGERMNKPNTQAGPSITDQLASATTKDDLETIISGKATFFFEGDSFDNNARNLRRRNPQTAALERNHDLAIGESPMVPAPINVIRSRSFFIMSHFFR